MFDAGDAFVAWCNAAGGINGRKIVLHKRDAKLLNGAARVIDACQTDFMLVGGATTSDAATVKPRLGCGLGAIPAIDVSTEASQAGLQVQPNPTVQDSVNVTAEKLLAQHDPTLASHFGMYAVNLASVLSEAVNLRSGLQSVGLQVPDYQEFPYTVDNWRPYFASSLGKGTQVVLPVGVPSFPSFFAGMQDVGFRPKAVLGTIDVYQDDVRKALAAAPSAPTVYAGLQFLPFQLADQSPVVQQVVDILTKTRPLNKLDGYSAESMSAWLLWAASATACGSNLTANCVLQHASSYQAWDAGGFAAPVDLRGKPVQTPCTLLVRATKSDFVYDRAVTQPNHGFFNCDAKNVVPVS